MQNKSKTNNSHTSSYRAGSSNGRGRYSDVSSPAGRPKRYRKWFYAIILLALVVWLTVFSPFSTRTISDNKPLQKQPTSSQPQIVVKPVSTVCTGNTITNLIVVSISQRHLWACGLSAVLFNSPVVTGMEQYPADLTPPGTYHIYAKETNIYLKGSDTTGSWDDYVNYWMPFLFNSYGAYGLHDATWRAANAFGNISPYSNNASHGCVELPLATARWIYNWAPIGTTVTIES